MNTLPMLTALFVYVVLPIVVFRIMRWRGNDDEPKARLQKIERLIFVWVTSVAACCWCWIKRKVTDDDQTV